MTGEVRLAASVLTAGFVLSGIVNVVLYGDDLGFLFLAVGLLLGGYVAYRTIG
jgi:cytochrome c biogenesis factor